MLKELKKLLEIKPPPPPRTNPTQHHNNTDHSNTETTHHINSHSNRHRQTDTKDDRISLYADDNMTIITKTEHVKKVKEITRRYGKATGGALNEDKTTLIRIGKMRKQEMTNAQLGAEFRIMQEEERECYLGDVVGAEVTEEERYGEILMKIEKTGQQWNREGIGIYGQALVANTILLGKITHRASVNTISTAMRKKLKEKCRAFIWKGGDRRAKVRWEVLVCERRS